MGCCRKGFLILFLNLFLSPAPRAVGAIEYVDARQIQKLHEQFKSAQTPSHGLTEKTLHGNWRCDLYGVRSRLQIERNLELYVFPPQPGLRNIGAQVVKDYTWTKEAVVGRRGNIRDSLRILGTDRLISRLEFMSPDSAGSAANAVLAYGLCRKVTGQLQSRSS